VQKYRVGDFRVAKHFISRAMRIYNRILREDHLHASSAKRVLALIIEEEALDIPFQPFGFEDKILNEMKDEALEKAHLLQQESLAIAKKTFGDQSVVSLIISIIVIQYCFLFTGSIANCETSW